MNGPFRPNLFVVDVDKVNETDKGVLIKMNNTVKLINFISVSATELTETLSGALRVSPARLMRARRGRCDQCAPSHGMWTPCM
jgi:hypothetical protein